MAKASRCADQTWRLLAVAEIHDGRSRTEAVRVDGVVLQTLRDWVLAFNVLGPDGLLRGKAPGNPPILTDAHRQALAEMLEKGPDPAVHGIVRWRLVDLMQWLFGTYRLSISKQRLSRELQAMGYAKLSARPCHHAQEGEALEAFKKMPARLAQIAAHEAAGKAVEIWWADEARIGQKNKNYPPIGQARHQAIGTPFTNEPGPPGCSAPSARP